MVPAAYVILDTLPLSPSGKLDRGALPPPGSSALVDREPVPPRTPVEQAVAAAFAEVLRLPAGRVGAKEGFFELGGHSLLATQLVSRLRVALGVDLPLRALFESPVVADLAARIEWARGGAPETAPIPRIPRDGDLP